MENKHQNETFPGFPPEPVTNYWPYPKALNGWWNILSPTEQKVLDYILRHTWGFKKIADAISINQFLNGITSREGKVIDRGTGIKCDKTIRRALKGLVAKGFIERIEQIGRQPIYKLKIDSSQEITPLPNNGNTILPSPGRSTPSQNLATTIKDDSINDFNKLPASQEPNKKTYKKEITHLIDYLSLKLGVKFPNYGKQTRFTKSILESGYTTEDVSWAIDKLSADPWWIEHSFDMKNVADEIPKLLSRTTYKKK